MNPVVTQIVDRLHVSASDVDVIRAIRKALSASVRDSRQPAMRQLRKELYRQGIADHHSSQLLYRACISGRFS